MYEFSCPVCEYIFEEFHSIKDAPRQAKCPDCGKDCLRHYSSCNFVLKGSDWPSKEIRQGDTGACRSKNINDIMNDRVKKGLDPRSKPVAMTDAEYQKRLGWNKRWLDENK